MSKKKHNKEKKEKGKQPQAGQKPHKNLRWALYAVVSFLALLFSVFGYFWFPGDVYYEVRETYTFEGNGVGNINLTLILPTSGAFQEVLEHDITGPGRMGEKQ